MGIISKFLKIHPINTDYNKQYEGRTCLKKKYPHPKEKKSHLWIRITQVFIRKPIQDQHSEQNDYHIGDPRHVEHAKSLSVFHKWCWKPLVIVFDDIPDTDATFFLLYILFIYYWIRKSSNKTKKQNVCMCVWNFTFANDKVSGLEAQRIE